MYYKETIDNWGRIEASMKGPIIYNVLHNPDEFTDDMMFEDDKGKWYNIDELIGKEIQLNDIGIFTVPNLVV